MTEEFVKVRIPHKDQGIGPGGSRFGLFMPGGARVPNVGSIAIKPHHDGFTEVTVTLLAEIEVED